MRMSRFRRPEKTRNDLFYAAMRLMGELFEKNGTQLSEKRRHSWVRRRQPFEKERTKQKGGLVTGEGRVVGDKGSVFCKLVGILGIKIFF